jgi:triphosphoribosyl-dephospho-CoA synthase
MPGLSEDDTRDLFLAACRAELDALKPGNVHVHAGGHGMEPEQFEASAVAAAPWIAAPRLKPGERILRAVEAAMAAAGCNTNLGILLLSGPLAAAAQTDTAGGLSARVKGILAALDDEDAAAVFEAIRRANPGGLGTAPDQDVAAHPTVGLRQAMAMAADRDRIARAYVTDFEEIFAFGLPTLERVRRQTADAAVAVTTLHMAILAQYPDSHIARKFGRALAGEVWAQARQRRWLWDPVADRGSLGALLAFDAELKGRQLNPGTTADFVVGTLLAAAICSRLPASSLR